MKSVPAAKFKEQCLALLDHVDPEGIIITKHGKPVAKLVPIQTDSAKLIGSFKGKIKIKGSILSTGAWKALARIRKYRDRLPANFRFDRIEANARR
jgi:prevent-host-death family protein